MEKAGEWQLQGSVFWLSGWRVVSQPPVRDPVPLPLRGGGG